MMQPIPKLVFTLSLAIWASKRCCLENTGDAGEAETEHDDGGIDETESRRPQVRPHMP